jgi:hypothetical protein
MATTGFIARASRAAAFIAAAALVAGSTAPAYAMNADPEGSVPAAGTAKAQDKSARKTRKVCVETEITGSRLVRKTCKTREQWIKEDGIDPLDMTAR